MKGLYVTLIRREFWENKSLWIAPLAAAVLYPCVEAFLNGRSDGSYVSSVDSTVVGRVLSRASFRQATVLIGLVTGIALFAYLLECLNAERRDRSILFWKSLPVSDTQTVLAKLVTATLVWLGVIPLIFLTQPIMMLVDWVRFETLRPYINIDMLAAWPAMLAHIGLTWAHDVLWCAPVATWLMLVSVAAKRAPLAYAVLPPAVPVLWERLMLDSSHITEFVGGRLLPWLPRRIRPIEARWWIPFQDPGMWIGLAVAAGMLYIVIRLRRYRDDT